MCERLAEAAANGGDICGMPNCGGPNSGRTFPDYRGPLLGVKASYCYRCGENSDKIIEVGDQGRVGLCKNCYQKVFQEK